MRDFLTAEFRWPEPPLHGSLEQLFDLMDAVQELGSAAWPSEPVRPIEGRFLL